MDMGKTSGYSELIDFGSKHSRFNPTAGQNTADRSLAEKNQFVDTLAQA